MILDFSRYVRAVLSVTLFLFVTLPLFGRLYQFDASEYSVGLSLMHGEVNYLYPLPDFPESAGTFSAYDLFLPRLDLEYTLHSYGSHFGLFGSVYMGFYSYQDAGIEALRNYPPPSDGSGFYYTELGDLERQSATSMGLDFGMSYRSIEIFRPNPFQPFLEAGCTVGATVATLEFSESRNSEDLIEPMSFNLGLLWGAGVDYRLSDGKHLRTKLEYYTPVLGRMPFKIQLRFSFVQWQE